MLNGHHKACEFIRAAFNGVAVSKKAIRRERKLNKPQTIKIDEAFELGPLRVERFGQFVRFKNNATPEQHAALLDRMAHAHKKLVSDLATEISSLQSLIQRHDPIKLMDRAAYMLVPILVEYFSENQYSAEEARTLPAVEYLQYLIGRTPMSSEWKPITETDWDRLWELIIKVLRLTQDYLFTRKTITTPPTEIDELRFFVDSRRLGIRICRYQIYFSDHLKDSLIPYDSAIRDAYGIDVDQLVHGLEEIHAYQKTGVIDRYDDLRKSNEAIMTKLEELGHSIHPGSPEGDIDSARALLESPALERLYSEAQESARLALTPAIFDITDLSSLPQSVLSVLSVRPGESILTTLTGPDHDDLSPLSISILHDKPFVETNDRFYYFFHSGLEDRVADIIERDLFGKYPGREAALRRRRDDYLEAMATDLLVSVIKPDKVYRNAYYPNPDRPGTLTELDAIITLDDVLFLIEVKAGALSAAARRGAPESLYGELADTIGTGQRQSERAEKYIGSADEVPFFDDSGKREICRIRHDKFRRIFRVVVTREDLGWVGAQIAIMSVIEPTLSDSFPWHISVDDLRAVAELFQDSNLRFIHFLERRLEASQETTLSQHDEIEHIGLYNKINFYHDLPVEGMDRMTFDASWMRDIDEYFSEKYRGNSPELPKQHISGRLAKFLDALKDCGLTGRFAAASIILDMDGKGREDLEGALEHLNARVDAGGQPSVRLPCSEASYGLTLSSVSNQFWQRELILSAVQMEQSHCSRWVVIRIDNHSPYAISQIETLTPGRFSSDELATGYEHIDKLTRQRIETERPGRNDRCPCGSGTKFKKCHGR